VASFSFGAGNAAKLVRMPLYGAGRIVTLLVPRSKDRWVFGCGAGIGDGALALWRTASTHEDSAVQRGRAVWLVGSEREARDAAARGIPTLSKHSLRGFWATARARVLVITHGFGDVNRYAVSGAFVAQLWHGIPLKRIGIDSPETMRAPGVLGAPLAHVFRMLVRAMYRRAAGRIDLLPAASHLVRGRLESAFGLDDARVPTTGEPRVDVLSIGDAATRRTAARDAIAALVSGVAGERRLVLYAPTWRDGDEDPAIPDTADWAALQEILERDDALLLVRSHPLGVGAYEPPPGVDRVRMLGSDLVADVTPLLPAFDVVITDYSSLVFDAALVPLPAVFLAPDVASYARRRGFYGRYVDVAGPDWASAWRQADGAGAVAQLHAVLDDDEEHARRVGRARDLSAQVHAHHDGGNAERVYQAIRRRTARHDHASIAARTEGTT
jgi:CDP-glycerol glycerophosphotransferase (TagB/SpsB family)